MGKVREAIDDATATWLARQHMFFVATAPLAGDGHVNVSPKGLASIDGLPGLPVSSAQEVGR